MNLMNKLNHPNIVKFITGWYKPKLNKVIPIIRVKAQIKNIINSLSLILNIPSTDNNIIIRTIGKIEYNDSLNLLIATFIY